MSELGQTTPFELPPPEGSILDHATLIHGAAFGPPAALGAIGSIGKYPVSRVIGGGGMGLVVLARRPGTDQQVAIKVLRTELRQSPPAVKRFLTEARHMSQLSHPHVLELLEIGESPEMPHYVMPYVPRGSLGSALQDPKQLTAHDLLRIAREVAEAVAFAHGRGLIHRDLKPANILIGNDGSAYVCDFGLVRTIFNDTTVDASREQREGSAPYMSPAVARGEAEDTRCDIYSFGATLYEMLTGKPPYEGRSTQQVIEQIKTGPPEPIRKINPQAPVFLTRVADGCMARELRERYASMNDVAEDLRRAERNEKPIGARGSRWRLKARRKVVVTALLAIATIVGVAVAIRPHKPQSTPFRGIVHGMSRIEVEDFDEGGEGISWHDVTTISAPDFYRQTSVHIRQLHGATANCCVDFVQPGEWLIFTVNISDAGPWDLVMPVRAAAGGTVHFELNGRDISGPIELQPAGRGWCFLRVPLKPLSATGICKIKLSFDTAGTGNAYLGVFDWFGFVRPRTWPQRQPASVVFNKGKPEYASCSLAIDARQKYIFTGTGGGLWVLWSLDPLEVIRPNVAIGAGVFHHADLSDDGTKVLTAGELGKYATTLWDVETGQAIHHYNFGGPLPVDISPDSRRLLVSGGIPGGNSSAAIFDIDDVTGKNGVLIPQHSGEGSSSKALRWLPDSQRVVVARDSQDGLVGLYDAKRGDLIREFVGHTGKVGCIEVSEDGKRMLTGADDRSLRLWDIDSGQCIGEFLGHADGIMGVQFVRGTGLIRSISWDRTAITWDANTSKPLSYVDFGSLAIDTAQSLTPDGTRLVVCETSGSMTVWTLPSN
jgi:serine/threonine protein kinase